MKKESTVNYYLGYYNKFVYKVDNNKVQYWHNGTWHNTNSIFKEQILSADGYWIPLTYEEAVLELL